MRREGKRIAYVRSTLVPDQETVFSLVEADSTALVAELNERASIPTDRISEAVPATESARDLDGEE